MLRVLIVICSKLYSKFKKEINRKAFCSQAQLNILYTEISFSAVIDVLFEINIAACSLMLFKCQN